MTINYDFLRLLPNLKPFQKFLQLILKLYTLTLNRRELKKGALKS